MDEIGDLAIVAPLLVPPAVAVWSGMVFNMPRQTGQPQISPLPAVKLARERSCPASAAISNRDSRRSTMRLRPEDTGGKGARAFFAGRFDMTGPKEAAKSPPAA